jgi:hypothetical protein
VATQSCANPISSPTTNNARITISGTGVLTVMPTRPPNAGGHSFLLADR